MACEECSKCWFNYIEDCEGQDSFKEDNCRKKNLKEEVLLEDSK